ncbi:MAG: aldo/keto reductase, partial [Candidatus Omnitrophota bacterium]
IDTAPVYGDGRAEEVVGKGLRSAKKTVIIAAKCGLEKKGHSIRPNLSAAFIRKEVEASLRRLSTETIDLYQCHWPDPNTSIRETFGEMNKLVKEGKIRYIGVSNFNTELMDRISSIAPVISDQVQYSLLCRDAEKDLMPFCLGKNISILSYGSLAGGLLTGKYKEPPVLTRGDVRSFFYKYYTEPFWTKARAVVGALEGIARERGVPAAQMAIRWILANRAVASCIVGCRTPEQLRDNTGAADWQLSEEEISKMQSV